MSNQSGNTPNGGVNDGGGLWLGYLIITIALVCITGGGYLLYTQYKKPASPADASDPGSNDSSSEDTKAKTTSTKPSMASSSYSAGSVFPLHNGSSGDEVKNLQHFLNTKFSAGLVEDGIWGSKTTAAANTYLQVSSVSKAEYDNEVTSANSDSSSASTIPAFAKAILEM